MENLTTADWIQIAVLVLGLASFRYSLYRTKKKQSEDAQEKAVEDALRQQKLEDKIQNWIEAKEKVDSEQSKNSSKLEVEFSEFKKIFYDNSKAVEKRVSDLENVQKLNAKEFAQISNVIQEIKELLKHLPDDLKKTIEKEIMNMNKLIEEKIKNMDDKIKPVTTRARKS